MFSFLKNENKKLKMHIQHLKQELKKEQELKKAKSKKPVNTINTVNLAQILKNHFC